MAVPTVRLTVRYDGKCLVPTGPVDLPLGADLDAVISLRPRTWAEKRLGIKPIIVTGEGPSASEIVIEERGPA